MRQGPWRRAAPRPSIVKPLDSTAARPTEESYQSILDIAVKRLTFTVPKPLPLQRDDASIILTSSMLNRKRLLMNSAYGATRAAVRSPALTWTTDLKDHRIRGNALSPGSMATMSRRRAPCLQAWRYKACYTAYFGLSRFPAPRWTNFDVAIVDT
jgi:NAD(P)-dependent dehydrogenase (short-subunit alcohol dehydrogenase family)